MPTKNCFSLLLAAVLFGASSAHAQEVPTVPARKAGVLHEINDAFTSVFERIAPAVVVIEVTKKASGDSEQSPFDFDFFFRNPQGEDDNGKKDNTRKRFRSPQRPPQNEGSGFIVRQDGYIFTNNHVVAGAEKISVRMKDGRQFAAKVVGVDDKTDVAVIKVEATGLPVAELANSDDVKVGQLAFAIGAPYNLDYSFTTGVVSAKGRSNLYAATYEEYIQTDASINPGNSGGPLCDIDGKVIGMNTLIHGINKGLGFAIPINMAEEVGLQLIANNGKIVRPWIGVRIETLGDDPATRDLFKGIDKGVIVHTIEPDAPAYTSDLRPADVITEVDGVAVATARELQKQVLRKKVGQQVQLTVWRKGKLTKVPITTGELPGERAQVSNEKSEAPAKEDASMFGLQVQDLNKELASKLNVKADSGVLVTDVAEGSPAELADIQREDVITEVDSSPVATVAQFKEAMGKVDIKKGAVLYIDRKGEKTFTVLKAES